MISPKVFFLEMELFRLEKEFHAAPDAGRRHTIAEQIMMNLDTLRELENNGRGSKKIDSSEWRTKYSLSGLPAGTAVSEAASPASAAPIHAANLEEEIEAISGEPFDPQRYAEKKSRIEGLMGLLVRARESSASQSLTTMLTRLWEVAVREDDAYDNHLRTTQRG